MATQVLENRRLRKGNGTTGIALLAGYLAVYAAALYAMVRFAISRRETLSASSQSSESVFRSLHGY
jgi:hypothetical protein